MRGLSDRQWEVLVAVADGRVTRHVLCGEFEPYLLEGHAVDWTVRGLRLRGMVTMHRLGPPSITERGRRGIAECSEHLWLRSDCFGGTNKRNSARRRAFGHAVQRPADNA